MVNETLILPFLIKFANNTASYKFKQIFNVHLNHLLKNCITLIDDKREIDNQVASELILRICSSYKAVIRYLVNRESLIIEWSLTSHQVSQLNHFTEVRFASFLSGGFTTMAVINPPKRKLEKRTSVHLSEKIKLEWIGCVI